MSRSAFTTLLIISAFAIGIAFGLSRQQPAAIALEAGTLLEPARNLQPFTLATAADANFTNADLQGRWTLVFFGFANCPDICPTTLQLLAAARAQAELPDALAPTIALISVDPERDDAQTLARYVDYFGDNLLGVTGAPDMIEQVATDFGVVYQRVETGTDGQYTMDHSGSVLLINPDGQLRAVFSPPLSRTAIAADLAHIIG
ncbi:MAG: SCO family protein [Pseudomonadota bacterium]